MAYSTGFTPPSQTPWASPLAHPQQAQPAFIPHSAPVTPLPVQPRRRRAGTALLWVAPIVVLALIAVVAYFLGTFGRELALVGMVVALVPLAGVLIGVRIVDRWEPEPIGLVLFALLWGAAVSILVALVVDAVFGTAFAPGENRAAMQLVLQAPVVEEVAKGLGVLLVAVLAKRAFDGPVDGIVYGALVGAGFAFTENIQYFALSLHDGGSAGLAGTFFLRGIVSPFAHVMFTAVTGFALGLAARRGRGVFGAFLLGLIGATALHMFWNWSAGFTTFYPLYFALQVPLFIGFVVGVLALRREERRLTMVRLGEYAAAGWFTPQEVVMLATPAGRRDALAWARRLPGHRKPIMQGFIRTATRLAATRQRAITGRDRHAAEEERVLLQEAMRARAQLLSR